MIRTPVGLAIVLSVLLAGADTLQLHAQTPRDFVVRDWEKQRDVVLAYVEAMPEEQFTFRPTPGVRTFSEQIDHIVRDHLNIVRTAFERPDAPAPRRGDPHLHEKDELLERVRSAFDWVLEVVAATPDAELHADGEVFGRYRVPRWRALQRALEHGTWTLGQVVPYLRLNGVEPPPYPVFPSSEAIPVQDRVPDQ